MYRNIGFNFISAASAARSCDILPLIPARHRAQTCKWNHPRRRIKARAECSADAHPDRREPAVTRLTRGDAHRFSNHAACDETNADLIVVKVRHTSLYEAGANKLVIFRHLAHTLFEEELSGAPCKDQLPSFLPPGGGNHGDDKPVGKPGEQKAAAQICRKVWPTRVITSFSLRGRQKHC